VLRICGICEGKGQNAKGACARCKATGMIRMQNPAKDRKSEKQEEGFVEQKLTLKERVTRVFFPPQ